MKLFQAPEESELTRILRAAEYLERREDGQELAARIWSAFDLLQDLDATVSPMRDCLDMIVKATLCGEDQKLTDLLDFFNRKVSEDGTCVLVPEVQTDTGPAR